MTATETLSFYIITKNMHTNYNDTDHLIRHVRD